MWTHSIESLIRKLEKHGHSVSEDLIDAAEELSDWEANSRYGHSLVATRNEIQNAIQIAERTLAEVDILASEASIDRSDALTDATDK